MSYNTSLSTVEYDQWQHMATKIRECNRMMNDISTTWREMTSGIIEAFPNYSAVLRNVKLPARLNDLYSSLYAASPHLDKHLTSYLNQLSQKDDTFYAGPSIATVQSINEQIELLTKFGHQKDQSHSDSFDSSKNFEFLQASVCFNSQTVLVEFINLLVGSDLDYSQVKSNLESSKDRNKSLIVVENDVVSTEVSGDVFKSNAGQSTLVSTTCQQDGLHEGDLRITQIINKFARNWDEPTSDVGFSYPEIDIHFEIIVSYETVETNESDDEQLVTVQHLLAVPGVVHIQIQVIQETFGLNSRYQANFSLFQSLDLYNNLHRDLKAPTCKSCIYNQCSCNGSCAYCSRTSLLISSPAAVAAATADDRNSSGADGDKSAISMFVDTEPGSFANVASILDGCEWVNDKDINPLDVISRLASGSIMQFRQLIHVCVQLQLWALAVWLQRYLVQTIAPSTPLHSASTDSSAGFALNHEQQRGFDDENLQLHAIRMLHEEDFFMTPLDAAVDGTDGADGMHSKHGNKPATNPIAAGLIIPESEATTLISSSSSCGASSVSTAAVTAKLINNNARCPCCKMDWIYLAEMIIEINPLSDDLLLEIDVILDKYGMLSLPLGSTSSASTIGRTYSSATKANASQYLLSARERYQNARNLAARRRIKSQKSLVANQNANSSKDSSSLSQSSQQRRRQSGGSSDGISAGLSFDEDRRNSNSSDLEQNVYRSDNNPSDGTDDEVEDRVVKQVHDMSDESMDLEGVNNTATSNNKHTSKKQFTTTKIRLQWKMGQMLLRMKRYSQALTYLQSAYNSLNWLYVHERDDNEDNLNVGSSMLDELDEVGDGVVEFDENGMPMLLNPQKSEKINYSKRVLQYNSSDAELSIDFGAAQSHCVAGTASIVTLKDTFQYCTYYFGVSHSVTLKSINALRIALDNSVYASSYYDLFVSLLDLPRLQASFGVNHLQFLIGIRVAGVALSKVGSFQQSLSLLQQTATALESVVGKTHHESLLTYVELARVLDDSGAYEDSLPVRLFLVENTKRINLNLYLLCLQLLCSTYQSNNQNYQAKYAYMKALDEYSKVVGKNSDQYMQLMKQYTNFIRQKYMADVKLAVDVFKSLLKLQTYLLGENHEQTLQSHANIAAAMEREECFYDEAIEEHKFVVAKRREINGKDDPTTLQAMLNFASFLNLIGSLEQSLALYQEVAETKSQLLGSQHKDVLKVLSSVATLLRDLERTGEANALEMKLMEQYKKPMAASSRLSSPPITNMGLGLGLGPGLGQATSTPASTDPTITNGKDSTFLSPFMTSGTAPGGLLSAAKPTVPPRIQKTGQGPSAEKFCNMDCTFM